jgi:flagellar protein FlaF
MTKSPTDVYESISKDTMSARELEAHVLMKAAARIFACQERWDESGHFERLDDALRYNQRLWTIFQAELTDEDCPLPRELRQNVLNLSIFVDKRTFDVMSDPTKAKLDILMAINCNIADGLSATPPTAALV